MANVHVKERELEREIAQRVEDGIPGTEVLAVELVGPERLCVYVDHPQGVDHALCERVTGLLDTYRRSYGIDVSSPGPERPVRKREHFRSAVGRRVAIRTADDIGGRKRFRGEIVAADERVVKVAAGKGEQVDIPYDSIVRGNLIYEGS